MDKDLEIKQAAHELILGLDDPEKLVVLIDGILEPSGIYCGLNVFPKTDEERHVYLLGAFYKMSLDKELGYITLSGGPDDVNEAYGVQKTEIGIQYGDIEEVTGFIDDTNDHEFTCIRIVTSSLIFEIMVDF